jgi:serine protease AprX
MAIGAAGPGALANTDGSGWTRCARTLAIGTLTAATLLSGTALASRAAAAGASRPEQVIVRGQAGCAASVAATVASLGGKVTTPLGILDGAAATVAGNRLSALRAAPCVASVTPDGTVSLSSIGGYDPTADAGSLYNTEQIIGAQAAWKAGVTGKNVGVALIDTGVAPVQGLNGKGQVINGPDLSFDSQTPALTYLDEYGHGTSMAGIIAGRDQPKPGGGYATDTNDFLGVAPDAHIVNIKVGDEQGVVDVSQVLAAIDAVVQYHNLGNVNIRVINLSFGTSSAQSYLLDPLAFAAEVAWKSGIVVVAAAGNSGSASAGLNDPAYDPYLIAVGAADTQGSLATANHTVASFSSTGNGSRNPDLVAPGVHIESLRDPGSNIDLQYGSTATVGGRFFLGSGTSQAAAVVSGAAALLLSVHPDWSPDDVKYALTATATSLPGQPASAQGSGEVNVAAALQLAGPAPKPAPPAPGTTSTPPPPPSPPFKPGQHPQSFGSATGAGSLDASRGGLDVTSNGVALTGEQDIMGNAFNATAMAAAEVSRSTWNSGKWNGAGWAGAGWAGAGWASTTWSGAGWAGAGWAGAGWAGSTWNGAGWAGAGWAGAGWAGAGWAGAGWAGAGWAGAGWAGAGWADASWD